MVTTKSILTIYTFKVHYLIRDRLRGSEKGAT